jgi:transposase
VWALTLCSNAGEQHRKELSDQIGLLSHPYLTVASPDGGKPTRTLSNYEVTLARRRSPAASMS